MITFSEALDTGWNDYHAGNHSNRYDFCLEPEAFRWWIQGYDLAKDWEQTETDFERD